jgi:hypothetical protein
MWKRKSEGVTMYTKISEVSEYVAGNNLEGKFSKKNSE